VLNGHQLMLYQGSCAEWSPADAVSGQLCHM